jgi:putative DNA primase/helicase
MNDSLSQFLDAIKAAGIPPPEEIIPDAQIHRFSTNGKATDDAGWYKLFADQKGGVFGDHRVNKSGVWQAHRNKPYTAAEQKTFDEQVKAARREREAQDAKRNADAAGTAKRLLKTAKAAQADHPYLLRKGVQPVSTLKELPLLRVKGILGYVPKTLDGRILLAPIKVGDKLSSVELIDEAGHKWMLKDGAVKGGYWATQKLPVDPEVIQIGEGVVTGLSAGEATHYPTLAAMSAGNLEAVARQMRSRYPRAALLILGELGNGQEQAEQAARAVNGRLALPDFGENPPDGLTDFNDMHLLRGLEEVRACLMRAVEKAQDETSAPGQGGGYLRAMGRPYPTARRTATRPALR